MALINCPECKKKVSETADSCPNCGYKFSEDEKKELKASEKKSESSTTGCLTLGLLIFTILVVGYLRFWSTNESHNDQHNLEDTQEKKSTRNEQDNSLSDHSLGYKLAVIETHEKVSEDDQIVKRFNNLLSKLDNKFVENEERISDITVSGYENLKERGISESMINLMTGMNLIYDPTNNRMKYNEYLSSYVVIRVQGRSHDETIEVFQNSLNEVGIDGVKEAMGVN